MCLRLHSDIKCDRTSLQVFTTSNSLRNIILPNSITSKETGAYYFKDTCVANLQALDNFFSVETKPTNLIVCACVQVANIFECPALRQHSCSKYDKRNCKKDKGNRCKWNKKNKRKMANAILNH